MSSAALKITEPRVLQFPAAVPAQAPMTDSEKRAERRARAKAAAAEKEDQKAKSTKGRRDYQVVARLVVDSKTGKALRDAKGKTTQARTADGKLRWTIRVARPSILDKETGRRKRVADFTEEFAGPFTAAKDRALEIVELKRKNSLGKRTKQGVGEYARSWLQSRKEDIAARTYIKYSLVVNRYIRKPLGSDTFAFGDTRLTALSTQAVRDWYARLYAVGLGKSTVHECHKTLKQVVKMAMADGYLYRDPTPEGSAAPQPKRKTGGKSLEKEHVQAVVTKLKGTKHYAMWYTELNTGLRPQELAGLMWRDLKGNMLTVQRVVTTAKWLKERADAQGDGKQLSKEEIAALIANAIDTRGCWMLTDDMKTEGSARTIELDDRTVAVLLAHKAEQDAYRAEQGSAYKNYGLIFPMDDGQFRIPDRIAELWGTAKKVAGIDLVSRGLDPKKKGDQLKDYRLYDLRHTHATHLLQSGIPVKTVSARLGHASAMQTLNTYNHMLDDSGSIAAEASSRLFSEQNPEDKRAILKAKLEAAQRELEAFESSVL